MSELVQLSRPNFNPYALLTDAVKEYEDAMQQRSTDARQQQQMDLQKQDFDLRSKEFASNDAYRTGTLKVQQDTQADQQKKLQAEQFIDLHVKPLYAAGDIAGAAKMVQDFTSSHPDLVPYLQAAAQGRAATPAEQASGNTGKFAQQQTAIAASGGTDPNAVNFTTKSATGAFMPSEGFTQQQATDLGARASSGQPVPKLGQAMPRPSGNSVPDFEARATGALTTAPQNQISQTAKDVANINEAGATKRTGMEIQGRKDIVDSIAKADAGVVTQGVLDDPQSFYALPTYDKKLVLQTLGRAPSKLGSAEVERLNAAASGRQIIDDADTIVKKWQGRGQPITGPFLGRFNAAEGKWGELIIPPNVPPAQQKEYAEDLAKLREWLTALPVQEAKALAGGRTAYQVIQAITSTSPSLSKGQDMFAGSTQGLRTRFEQIEDMLDKKQWGGKPPAGYKSARERTAEGNRDPKLQDFMKKNGITDEQQARSLLHDNGIPGY